LQKPLPTESPLNTLIRCTLCSPTPPKMASVCFVAARRSMAQQGPPDDAKSLAGSRWAPAVRKTVSAETTTFLPDGRARKTDRSMPTPSLAAGGQPHTSPQTCWLRPNTPTRSHLRGGRARPAKFPTWDLCHVEPRLALSQRPRPCHSLLYLMPLPKDRRALWLLPCYQNASSLILRAPP